MHSNLVNRLCSHPESRIPNQGSHPETVVSKMAALPHMRVAFNAVQPTALHHMAGAANAAYFRPPQTVSQSASRRENGAEAPSKSRPKRKPTQGRKPTGKRGDTTTDANAGKPRRRRRKPRPMGSGATAKPKRRGRR